MAAQAAAMMPPDREPLIPGDVYSPPGQFARMKYWWRRSSGERYSNTLEPFSPKPYLWVSAPSTSRQGGGGVEHRDVDPEWLGPGEDEATEATVDVEVDPASTARPGQLGDRIDQAVRVGAG